MDTMPNEDLMKQIRMVASTVPGVRGVEKCYARKTGLRYHVDLHLEVDPEITVRQSHEIAHNVRYQVREQLDWVARRAGARGTGAVGSSGQGWPPHRNAMMRVYARRERRIVGLGNIGSGTLKILAENGDHIALHSSASSAGGPSAIC